MAGNRDGGLKAAQTNKTKHGADYYVKIGRKGGQNGRGHEFAHGKVSPSEAGKIGGKISKRGPRYREDDWGFLRVQDDEPILGSVELQRSWKDKLLRRIK